MAGCKVKLEDFSVILYISTTQIQTSTGEVDFGIEVAFAFFYRLGYKQTIFIDALLFVVLLPATPNAMSTVYIHKTLSSFTPVYPCHSSSSNPLAAHSRANKKVPMAFLRTMLRIAF